MESQLATLATDTGTTFAKLFQVEGIQTILFKFWAFRVYTLNNLTPIRLFCVKGRFSGLSGIKTDHVWPEIRPLGFKGLISKAIPTSFLEIQGRETFVKAKGRRKREALKNESEEKSFRETLTST